MECGPIQQVVFGTVLEGMDVVRAIEDVPKKAGDAPVEKVVIIESGEVSSRLTSLHLVGLLTHNLVFFKPIPL